MDWDVVQVKKAIIRSSRKSAVLCVSEKLETSRRLKICGTNQVDYLITELDAGHQLLAHYQNEISVL
jgi:DeoR/GlpR family transcriptional regulator of sugar metabolism